MTAGPSSAGKSRTTGRSVQGMLTAAAKVSAVRGWHQGAGRTDAGVHALGQVCHVDLRKDWDEETRARRLECAPSSASHRGDRRREGERLVRCAVFRDQAPLPLSHHQPASRSDLRARAAPGACQSRSTARPCMRPRSGSSATMTSPPSVTPSVRQNRRSRRSTSSTSIADEGRHSHRCFARVLFCTPRCAPWSARWRWSAKASGAADDLSAASE